MNLQRIGVNRPVERIYLYRCPVDFRKSYRGLGAIVEQELGHDPFSGSLYAFINRKRDRIKILYWDNNGFVLYYKALAEEKFAWPSIEEDVRLISTEQLHWLLSGINIDLLIPHKTLHYQHLC